MSKRAATVSRRFGCPKRLGDVSAVAVAGLQLCDGIELAEVELCDYRWWFVIFWVMIVNWEELLVELLVRNWSGDGWSEKWCHGREAHGCGLWAEEWAAMVIFAKSNCRRSLRRYGKEKQVEDGQGACERTGYQLQMDYDCWVMGIQTNMYYDC